MLFKDLFYGIDIISSVGCLPDMPVSGIKHDAGLIHPGNLFVALEGTRFDGHDFIPQAFENGACAAVVLHTTDYIISHGAPYVIVGSTRAALAELWNNYYGRPSLKLRTAAVTGTNGKSSVAYLIYSVLKESGHSCGLIGTVENIVDGIGAPSSMTTPDPEQLYGILSRMATSGTEFAVTEATSHALALEKFSGMHFELGVFTNLTHDHLDFHGSMEKYAAAKAKLFEMCESSLFNLDDGYGRMIAARCGSKRIYFYSAVTDTADFYAENVILRGADGVSYDLICRDMSFHIDSRMPGMFSVYNTLAAASAACILGIGAGDIARGIAGLPYIKGRLEKLDTGTDFSVYIDFAHTPDALEKVLCTLRSATQGKLITVFGCGGDRDREKRPVMGRIASENSDIVIVTGDNSRSEDVNDIIEDIKKGIPDMRKCECIPDRRQAIDRAINIAAARDAVVLCGKGHEEYEIVKEGRRRFSEREAVSESVRKKYGCGRKNGNF